MNRLQIIGIVLIQNEDLFIDRVLSNIVDFCDEIIVADNRSTDQTAEKVRILRQQYPWIKYRSIAKPALSHDLISGYAGTDTWIFGVDGDEWYDPEGLKKLRAGIMAGEYQSHWMILGNVLNCVDLNLEKGYARGYLAPPCRSMTKLYNFAAIEAWNGPCPERLHGGKIRFQQGYAPSQRLELYKDIAWEDTPFRCCHLCFIRRSSREKEQNGQEVVRKNISDMNSERIYSRLKSRCLRLLGVEEKSPWKREKYMRGTLVKKSLQPFIS